MKKMLGIIIALLIIIIVIISIAFYTYIKNGYKLGQNSADNAFGQNGTGSKIETLFWGHSLSEVQNIIEEYYNNHGIGGVKAYCYYDESGTLKAKVSVQNEVKAEYSFNALTGEAVDSRTGEVVEFFISNEQTQRIQSNVEFTDNQCLAIGYVTDLNEVKFIDKYFSNETYGELPYYDFRVPAYQNSSDYGNKFVIVPKNEDVNITVYDCYIGEDGQLYTDNTLIQSISEPFIVVDDYIEYTPIMCIKFEYNGFEGMFPITFSGENGKLVLTGCETEVKDISLY